MTAAARPETECCPPFDPAAWQEKTVVWENKRFIRDHVFTLFFIPLNFGTVMRRLDARVRQAGATMPDWLCLADHTSKWNMDVYLAVDREVAGAENTTLSGKFYSKVYEGPFKDTGKWCKDFEADVRGKGLNMKKMYMWYTTCPKCAKKYGKNYVAVVARVE
jgi:hypothetical protein